jgi:hypothetical protein
VHGRNSLCQMKTSVFLVVTMHDNTQPVIEIKLPPKRFRPGIKGYNDRKRFRNNGLKFYSFSILYLKLYFKCIVFTVP